MTKLPKWIKLVFGVRLLQKMTTLYQMGSTDVLTERAASSRGELLGVKIFWLAGCYYLHVVAW